jgi:AcrR family transcriptional regulator
MRTSKRETEETRKRILEMAADEFRQHGIATSGIADLRAAVGLTHGRSYQHCESKEQLVAKATAVALDTLLDTLAGDQREETSVTREIIPKAFPLPLPSPPRMPSKPFPKL